MRIEIQELQCFHVECKEMSITHSQGRDMGKVSSHTGGVDDIIETELVDERGSFQKERERLFLRVVSLHTPMVT